MRRLWLLLALLLPLLPVRAEASGRAPDSGGTQYLPAPGHDLGDQVRAGGGFETLAPQGRGDGRTPRRVAARPEMPEVLPSRSTPSSVRDESFPAPEGCSPLCEHLPYHAAAPPRRG